MSAARVWDLGFWSADANLAGYFRLAALADRRVSWLWCAVAGADRRPVMIVDHELPWPEPGALEVRAPGLWFDLIVEIPDEHVTLGLEAFGVALDDPDDGWLDTEMRGEPTPIGFDLEWEIGGSGAVVIGELLVADEAHELDCDGSYEERADPLEVRSLPEGAALAVTRFLVDGGGRWERSLTAGGWRDVAAPAPA